MTVEELILVLIAGLIGALLAFCLARLLAWLEQCEAPTYARQYSKISARGYTVTTSDSYGIRAQRGSRIKIIPFAARAQNDAHKLWLQLWRVPNY